MTHSQKLEAVRKKVIEAVPEIMELKFGCKVYKPNYWENTEDKNRYGVIIGNYGYDYTKDEDRAVYVNWKESGSYSSVIPLYDFSDTHPEGMKILGRPICLADVLQAYFPDEEPINYNDDEKRDNYMDITYRWDKHNDSLEGQSEETLSFLYSLFYPHEN